MQENENEVTTNRIRIIILIILFFSLITCAYSQSKIAGYWKGTMMRDGSSMDVSFDFKMQNNSLLGFFNSPSQKASGIPLNNLQNTNDSLSFSLMSEPVTIFNCKIYDDKINGEIIQEGFTNGVLTLKHSEPPPVKFSFIDTSFKSGNHNIACRIYFPMTPGKHPAVVFLHGSGGEGMFAYQYFAEQFASRGIVTLIQDKQGTGKSTGDWTKANFDDLANDYINAVNFLMNFDKVNKSQIGIYGHSQGGTLAPLVASKSKDISFVIAAASIGDSVYKQDLYRVEINLRANDFTPAEISEAIDYYKSWLDMARTGNGFEKLDSINNSSKEKKWFEWVEAPPKDHWIWKYYSETGNYNSLDYWKLTTVPVLLVYGENDQIEDVKNYLKNIEGALTGQSHNPDVTKMILPNARHNLCIFPEKNDKFFWWHLFPHYVDSLISWILLRFKN
jgi:hypothetical protein